MRYKILSFLLFPAFLFVGSFAISVPPVYAAENVFEGVCDQAEAKKSPVCKEVEESNKGANPLFGPTGILTTATRILSIIVAIAAVIVLMLAGLKYITSGNNPQEVSNAREMIQYALIGLVLASMAQGIIYLVLNRI